MQESERLRVRIAPHRIHYLKFILEGYDGLALLSTLNPGTGLMEIRFPHENRSFLLMLLDDLAPLIQLDRFT